MQITLWNFLAYFMLQIIIQNNTLLISMQVILVKIYLWKKKKSWVMGSAGMNTCFPPPLLVIMYSLVHDQYYSVNTSKINVHTSYMQMYLNVSQNSLILTTSGQQHLKILLYYLNLPLLIKDKKGNIVKIPESELLNFRPYIRYMAPCFSTTYWSQLTPTTRAAHHAKTYPRPLLNITGFTQMRIAQHVNGYFAESKL